MNEVEFTDTYHTKFGNGNHGRNSYTEVCKEVVSVCNVAQKRNLPRLKILLL